MFDLPKQLPASIPAVAVGRVKVYINDTGDLVLKDGDTLQETRIEANAVSIITVANDAARLAIASPLLDVIYYQVDNRKFYVYVGGQWKLAGGDIQVYNEANLAGLNALPADDKKVNAVYITRDTNLVYRWNAVGMTFVQVGGGLNRQLTINAAGLSTYAVTTSDTDFVFDGVNTDLDITLPAALGQTLRFHFLANNNGNVVTFSDASVIPLSYSYENGALVFPSDSIVIKPVPLVGARQSVTLRNAIKPDGSYEWTFVNNESPFTGSTDLANGSAGLVPKPFMGESKKQLRGDGKWAYVYGEYANVAAFPTSTLLGRDEQQLYVAKDTGLMYRFDTATTSYVQLGLIHTSSATAPLNPTPGDTWYNTASETLFVRTSDANGPFWLDISSTGGAPTATPRITRFTTSGTFTPSAGVRYFEVEVQAAGGGGGGSGSPGTNQVGIAQGGTGGGYAKAIVTNVTGTYSVTVGAAGAAGTAGGGSGGTAGTSSLTGSNVTVSCAGGTGGNGGASISSPASATSSQVGGGATVTGTSAILVEVAQGGENSFSSGYSISGNGQHWIAGGAGGHSRLGHGGQTLFFMNNQSHAGRVAVGFGSGGGGAASTSGTAAQAGAQGAPAIVIIKEFF